ARRICSRATRSQSAGMDTWIRPAVRPAAGPPRDKTSRVAVPFANELPAQARGCEARLPRHRTATIVYLLAAGLAAIQFEPPATAASQRAVHPLTSQRRAGVSEGDHPWGESREARRALFGGDRQMRSVPAASRRA